MSIYSQSLIHCAVISLDWHWLGPRLGKYFWVEFYDNTLVFIQSHYEKEAHKVSYSIMYNILLFSIPDVLIWNMSEKFSLCN